MLETIDTPIWGMPDDRSLNDHGTENRVPTVIVSIVRSGKKRAAYAA